MAGKDNDVKHVIILDEKKKSSAETEYDEADELLAELNDYLGDDVNDNIITKTSGKKERTYTVTKKVKRPSKVLRKHILALAASVIVLVLLLFFVYKGTDAGYREPVSIYEEFLNREAYNGEDLSFAYANGLAKSQFRELRKAQGKSQEYVQSLEESEKESRLRHMEGTKSHVRITGASSLSEDVLLAYEADFRGIINDLSMSSYSTGDDPELAGAVKDLTDKLKDARITAGYDLYCTVSTSRPGTDGPVSSVENAEFTVVKIDGHWIMWDKVYDIFRMTF